MIRKENLILFLFLVFVMLQQGCGSGGSGGSGGAYQGGNDGGTAQISDPATATYMEAYNLFKKLKEDPDMTRVDIMTQVSDYLKSQSNVTSVELDASYRIIEFVANDVRFMIDDVEDIESAFVQQDANSSISSLERVKDKNSHRMGKATKPLVLKRRGLVICGFPTRDIENFAKRFVADGIQFSNFDMSGINSDDISGIAENLRNLNEYGLLIIASHGFCECLPANAQCVWLFSREIIGSTSVSTRSTMESEISANFPFIVFDGDCGFKYKEDKDSNKKYWMVHVKPSFFRKLFSSVKIDKTMVFLSHCDGCQTRQPVMTGPTENVTGRYLYDYGDLIGNDLVNSFLDAGSPVVYACSWNAKMQDMNHACTAGFLSLKDANGNSISEKESFINYGAENIDKANSKINTGKWDYYINNLSVNQNLMSLNYDSTLLTIGYTRTPPLFSDYWTHNGQKWTVDITLGNCYLVRFVKEDVECFFGNDINITAE